MVVSELMIGVLFPQPPPLILPGKQSFHDLQMLVIASTFLAHNGLAMSERFRVWAFIVVVVVCQCCVVGCVKCLCCRQFSRLINGAFC